MGDVVTMEKQNGVKVVFEGSKNILDFAYAVLYLTNIKSSGELDSVIDIHTEAGSDFIKVIMTEGYYDACKERLSKVVGKVISTEPVLLFGLETYDVKGKITKEVDAVNDRYMKDMSDVEPFMYLVSDMNI